MPPTDQNAGGLPVPGVEAAPMIRARIRMALPGDVWVEGVSRAFPDATFRLLAGVPLDDRTLELGEILAADPERALDGLREHPDVVSSAPLYTGPDRALVRYETREQGLFEFLGDSALTPEFPVVVADGSIEFTVTATRAQFDAFGDRLDATDRRYDLLSVVHGDDRSAVLTDRQRETLLVALREGYFAVPRECTLAEVADTMGVDKSSTSETVRRAVERVLDWYLAEAR